MSNKSLNSKKERIDKVLVDKDLASTHARAQAMILAGNILVNDQPVMKSGEMIDPDAEIRLKEPELKYVSRGALKLKKALEVFQISVLNEVAVDVGASTGGFTEVLLESGAKKVYTIDVGTNQLAWKIRSDPRVVPRENYNARHLKKSDFDENFGILVMDVSFISIRTILPAMIPVLKPGAHLAILFKPQFEVEREWVGEGGIVKDQTRARQVLEETVRWAKTIGLISHGVVDSPIQGTDGNHEYLIHFIFQS